MPDSLRPINLPEIIVVTLLRRQGETGVQTHFNEFGRLVAEKGGRYQVVTPFSYYKLLVYPVFAVRKIIQLFNGQINVWWYRTFHYIFLRLILSSKLTTEDCPIIYACCPLSAKAALLSRRDANQKVVLTIHFNKSQAYEWALSGQIKPGDWVYRGIEKLEEEVLPSVDALVFTTDFMQKYLEQRIPAIKNVKSSVIPPFASTSENLGSPGVTGDIISIGVLEPRKNQAYLLNVLSQAKKMGFRYSLTLVGDGPDRSRLLDLTDELNLQDQVHFLGFRPKAARYISGHRTYAHSSVMESFGLVLIEAMAHGIPVLAAPVGGIPEVFSNGVVGIYWPLNDPEDGARKLIDLLEDAETYRRAARAAKQRFEQQFTANAVADRLVRFLSDVCASGSPGQPVERL